MTLLLIHLLLPGSRWHVLSTAQPTRAPFLEMLWPSCLAITIWPLSKFLKSFHFPMFPLTNIIFCLIYATDKCRDNKMITVIHMTCGYGKSVIIDHDVMTDQSKCIMRWAKSSASSRSLLLHRNSMMMMTRMMDSAQEESIKGCKKLHVKCLDPEARHETFVWWQFMRKLIAVTWSNSYLDFSQRC